MKNGILWTLYIKLFSLLYFSLKPVCVTMCLVAQSCPTLCYLKDCSLPGFSVLVICQARILEWVAISSSRGFSLPRNQTASPVSPELQADSLPIEPLLRLLLLLSRFSCVRHCATWPHRWKPTRLPHPWDSPGKKTGVGCHFLLQCMQMKSESEIAQLCLTLLDPTDCSLPGSSTHGIFQRKPQLSL